MERVNLVLVESFLVIGFFYAIFGRRRVGDQDFFFDIELVFFGLYFIFWHDYNLQLFF